VEPCYTVLYVKRTLTAIRLDPDQLKALSKIGQREDRPISWLIRKAIDEFLERDGSRKKARR
jgi:predicted transcriptional regulator